MTNPSEPATATIDCDLCIVGAGYAALNGLNAAAKYLERGQRVVVIDKNTNWGGQWLHQYDFVRLHQPYRMFTAGDQPWLSRKDSSYLATRREVLEHLSSVPSVSARHLDVRPLFGHTYTNHRVREGRVELITQPVTNGKVAEPVRVRARRLLKASGASIETLPPFPVSSTRVRSVSVADPVLATREFLESSEPVYVVGSGKTAMDCVRHLRQARGSQPRSVNIITGLGMWFLVRDNLFPHSSRRFYSGVLTGDLFLRLAQAFDGHNEIAVMESLRRHGYAHTVWGDGGNCRFGLLSIAERDEVRARVDQVFRGHLVDVEGNRMVIRNGKEQREHTVADNAWFINCTSHLRHLPHEPVLQDSGLVCAPQIAFGFSGTSAYYGTHLWFRDELGSMASELYRVRIDVEPKLRFGPQLSLMILANTMYAFAKLPRSIPGKFIGDFNKWYPAHRQLPMFARALTGQSALQRKAERLLPLRFSDSPDPD